MEATVVTSQPPRGPLAGYPVRLEVDRPAEGELSRWLPSVKWILAIPHFVVLFFLMIGAAVGLGVAFFVVLFTRRYPRGIFNFVVGVLRWGLRVGAYSFLLMTDRYPPFSMQEEPGYPVRLEIEYPEEGVGRWRPFFNWLIAFPFLLVSNMVQNMGFLMGLYAWWVLLFKKRYPPGMFDIALVSLRFQVRGTAYVYFMTTKRPPIAWG